MRPPKPLLVRQAAAHAKAAKVSLDGPLRCVCMEAVAAAAQPPSTLPWVPRVKEALCALPMCRDNDPRFG